MCVVLYSTGSEFHSVGPETAKLREPMRTVRVRGTARFSCAYKGNMLFLNSVHCLKQHTKQFFHGSIKLCNRKKTKTS